MIERPPCFRAHSGATAIAMLLLACSGAAAAADYIDLRRPPLVAAGDPAAGREKAAVCLACHDAAGMSPAPIFPNLRGQTFEYLYWALVDFKRGQRAMSPMTPLVASSNDQDLRDLAAFYAASGSEPPARAPAPSQAEPAVLTRGERLYLEGDATLGLPPCQGCHGVEGSGHPLSAAAGAETLSAFRTYPALRAQQEAYVVAKLGEYRDGRLADSTNDFIMTGAAQNLDDASIGAIAAWLAALPP